jgi:hypothetical protein
MTERRVNQKYRVAIGGVGGSGTRLGAALLQMLGYYIGDDLNEPLDNLWFTLLFKRRSVLLEHKPDLDALIALFFARMSCRTTFTDVERMRVLQLAVSDRPQESANWLRERADSFLNGWCSRRPDQPWGWKEPNTHIIIDRLLEFDSELHYIHFVRHPLDMALSANQNQLANWGPVLLNREVVNEPRQSLAHWCAAHRRICAVMQQWPERTMAIDFDTFCIDPQMDGARVARFLDAELPDHFDDALGRLIDPSRPSSGRYKKVELTQFAEDDLSYVRELGYSI